MLPRTPIDVNIIPSINDLRLAKKLTRSPSAPSYVGNKLPIEDFVHYPD